MDQTFSPELGLPASERWRRFRNRHRHPLEAWLILTPILLYYGIFAIVPIAANVTVSLTRWNGITPPEWVGLDNYVRLMVDPFYQQIFANTAFFTVISMAISIPVGLLVAILLNQKVRGMGLYRSLWYIPAVTAAAIMSQVALVFISPFGGVLNLLLQSLGLPAVIWIVNVTALRAFIIAFSVWRGVGTTMVLYLAALQGIPQELYDAAMVDGAGPLARFWKLTVPLVRHMTFFVLITGIIGGFQIFEPILLISKGGPFNQTNTILNQIYKDAFNNSDFGLATANATLLGVFLLLASLMARRLIRQGEEVL